MPLSDERFDKLRQDVEIVLKENMDCEHLDTELCGGCTHVALFSEIVEEAQQPFQQPLGEAT